ncbi:hypothetical protein BUALT_Bualt08G0028200 [Buddleja alternifolia]|uniref:Uncharacterized protein n=1 Tax=Buddleja alternifolia TaxID=168488 RepID=A0AAV6XAH2_9LAMI|nr:hypothetical protein BUALT_Bualt08G0028200 [Buddleja alternifolia]
MRRNKLRMKSLSFTLIYEDKPNFIPDCRVYIKRRLYDSQTTKMIRPILASEIKEVLFAFSDDKAPGPEGYTAAFFKKAWSIIGHIIAGIPIFFNSRKLLKELNSTLIPKVEVSKKASDFQPYIL